MCQKDSLLEQLAMNQSKRKLIFKTLLHFEGLNHEKKDREIKEVFKIRIDTCF